MPPDSANKAISKIINSQTTTPAQYSNKKMKRKLTTTATANEAKMTSLDYLISSAFYAKSLAPDYCTALSNRSFLMGRQTLSMSLNINNFKYMV